MKKTIAIIAAALTAILISGSAFAAVNSCLNKCDKFSGAKFKDCMEKCGVNVTRPDTVSPAIAEPVTDHTPREVVITGGHGCPDGMVLIPSGSFSMGCSSGDDKCAEDEKPAKKVEITKSFCIDIREATQAEFEKVVEDNSSEFKDCGPDCPADKVSWESAKNFCEAQGKRLPTEAEWEYAARGGAKTAFFWGENFDADMVWFLDNSNESTHPAGKKPPNKFGLHDVLGNVWEWVQDCYDPEWYKDMPSRDPLNEKTGCENRSLRGGSWNDEAEWLRLSNRAGIPLGEAYSVDGVRCAKDM